MSFQDLISGPDGLHGQFLIHNIDAITLRPREMNRRGREIKDIAAADHDWLQITTKFIQIWSNLNGECVLTINNLDLMMIMLQRSFITRNSSSC